jgi:heme exporter protein CcmD
LTGPAAHVLIPVLLIGEKSIMQWLIEVLGTNMGGYGAYIWRSFLICAVVMLSMTIASLLSLKRAMARLSSLTSNADET